MSQSAKVYIYEFGSTEPVKILEAETLSDALAKEYESFPDGAMLCYGNVISDDKRVLFLTDEEKYNMAFAKGEFSLIFKPREPITILYIAVAVVGALLAATALAPKIPNVNPNGGSGAFDSSNNSLTERENQQRLLGLVPEIFGTVFAVPDLIQVPHTVYVNNKEVEYAIMCLGRGRYELDTNEIYDDTTRLKGITGSIVDIYEAHTSPNNPYDDRKFGVNATVFDDIVWDVKRCNSINGQTLKPSNEVGGTPPLNNFTDTFVIENKGMTSVICNFIWPQGIYKTHKETGNLVSESITVEVFIKPVTATGALLSGFSELSYSFTKAGGTNGQEDLRSQKADTLYCNLYNSWWKQGSIGVPVGGMQTEVARNSAILAVIAENVDPSTPLWITRIRNGDVSSPADANDRGDQLIIATTEGSTYGTWGRNFESDEAVANKYPNRLERPTWVTVYKETAINSGIIDSARLEKIHLLIDYRRFSASKQPVEYSSTSTTRQDYLNFSPNIFTGGGFDRIAVRIRRATNQVYGNATYSGVTSETKIKDIFVRTPLLNQDFGNVTTVYSKTFATEGALALKKRKLQIKATRAIRCYNQNGQYITINNQSGGTVPMTNTGTASVFTGSAINAPYIATNRTDHILVNILREIVLGNILFTSIDFNNIYNTLNTVSNYFASGDLKPSGVGANYPLSVTATAFNYTFDKEDMSAEEMIMVVCAVSHLTAYREFNMVKLLFEYSEMIPKLLFNHRNKVPNTQIRTVTFATKENYDGVTVDWRDPSANDTVKTFKVPIDGRAINALKVDLAGIRNERQAFRHAYRAYFSIAMKNIIDEFEALPEAQTLTKGMRIFSSDNTRANVLDGEVTGVSGTTLTLSQEADLTGLTNPYIYLQHRDGSVQSLPITQGGNMFRVVYSGSLTNSLIVDPSYYAQTIYQIWSDENKREKSFIVDERTTSENGTFNIKATIFNTAIYIADKITFWLQPVEIKFEDRTPNRRTPIAVGSPYIVTDTTRGYCVLNDSPASYLKFNTSDNLVLPSSFTMMAWVKVTAAGSTRDHVLFCSSNGTSFRFYIAEVSGLFSARATRVGTTTQTLAASVPNPTTAWNHVAVTYKPTNGSVGVMTLYVNGEKKDILTGVDTHTNPILYVAGNTNSQGFKGRMDGLILCHDALDADAIRGFYLFEKNMTADKTY